MTLPRPVEDADVLSIGRFVSALLRYWWLIALGAIGGAGATLILTAGQPEIFASQTKIIVQETRGRGSVSSSIDLQTSRDLAETYQQLISTRPVLEEAARRLGAGITADKLAGKITVDTVGSTRILRIHANDQNPVIAANIANTVADTFIEQTRQARLAEIASFQQAAQAQGLTDIGSLTADQLGGLNSLVTIESAEPATTPVATNRSRAVVLGGVLGSLAASGLAIFLEFVIGVVRNKERFEELFAPPVLAVLPRVETDLSHPLASNPDRKFEEAVRFLRTNLQFVPADQRLAKIAFTAADIGAGKSTATAYLAKAIVEAGKTVIVIDGDLRRPTLDRMLLGRRETVGLSSYLADAKLGLVDVLKQTQLEGLSVIPSGPVPPNPSELLNSERLSALFQEASLRSDYVLIDAPPLLIAADTPIIASRVDGLVFVVDTGKTRSRAVMSSFQALDLARAKILGAVLNKYRPARFSNYYGYGGYYYYGYGGYDGADASVNGARPGIFDRVRRAVSLRHR